MLEKKGHTVTVANNGKEAVSAFSKQQFQIVFMDVKMPVMNGFEATAKIREMEQTRSKDTGLVEHIPIIAMTAHAMKGDREKCLEAGMDDYIPKPFDVDRVLEVISQWVSQETDVQEDKEEVVSSDTTSSAIEEQSVPVIDFEDALERMYGDEELLEELVAIFIETYPEQVKKIRTAIEQNNPEELERAGHSLKGAAKNLSANPISELSFRLEKMGSDASFDEAEDVLTELESELGRFEKFFADRNPKS